MSSYVVNDDTLDRLVSFLYLKAQRGDYWPVRWLADQGHDVRTPDACKALAADMFALNVRAIDERYGEGEAAQFRPLDYAYHFTLNVKEMWAYSSLRCWISQCSEGTIPDTPLYQLMVELLHRMAMSIVENKPEFEAAPWG